MKLQSLLIPFLALALMACGQLKPREKNAYNKNLYGASVSGSCVALQAGYNSAQSNSLLGYSVCPTADASSVVIRYSASASNGVCVYPSNGSVSLVAKCFAPSAMGGDMSLSWPGISFNAVVMIQQQDKGAFETVTYGAYSGSYATAQFR